MVHGDYGIEAALYGLVKERVGRKRTFHGQTLLLRFFHGWMDQFLFLQTEQAGFAGST